MAAQLIADEVERTPVGQGSEWQTVQRILESSAFIRSEKLKSFLIYITERGLSGRTDEITEQQIGVAVFGRRTDYSPGEDSIVRSQARLLRAKLDAYFETEGIDEPLRITIPKGSYIPIFEEKTAQAFVLAQRPDEIEVNAAPAACRNVGWGIERYGLLACLILLVAIGVWSIRSHWTATSSMRRPTHAFWGKVFDPSRPTLIVTTDSGLAMQDDLLKRGVTLEEYISGRSREQLDAGAAGEDATEFHLAGRRYVTLVDLRVTQQLLHLPEASTASVAFARDLKLDDVKHSNLVLLGARASNPWINLFWNDLDFVIDRNFVTHDAVILNRRPRNGEPDSYRYSPREPARIYFCAIAFEPANQNAGSHLLLQGTSMVGVQMCAATVLDDAHWKDVLSTVNSGGTTRGFEVLMRSNGPENGISAGQILAVHVH